jgi:hypothetical protein
MCAPFMFGWMQKQGYLYVPYVTYCRTAAGQAYNLAALGCILPAASASMHFYTPTIAVTFLLQNQLELAGSAAGQAGGHAHNQPH